MNDDRQSYLLDQALQTVKISPDSSFCVAGGAVTSVFASMPINDLDLFFINRSAYDLFTRNGLKDQQPKVETDSAASYLISGQRVQLIKRIFGTPSEIISKFDFTIAMGAYSPDIHAFALDERFLADLAARRLYYVPGQYPIASLWRAKKFMQRGYVFPAVESIKLALAINSVHIATFKDLKEQLDGIDTLFLKELTDVFLAKSNEPYDLQKALEFMDQMLRNKLNLEGL